MSQIGTLAEKAGLLLFATRFDYGAAHPAREYVFRVRR